MCSKISEELRDTSIVVNSVSPGFVKTDLTGHAGYLTPAEGAAAPVRFALLQEDAVSGRFANAERELPW